MRRRCKHCGDDTGTPDFDTCGRCAVLLEGLGDVTIDPPPGAPPQVFAPGREPGSDDLAEDEEARRARFHAARVEHINAEFVRGRRRLLARALDPRNSDWAAIRH